MTPSDRRQLILDRLEQAGACSYDELALAGRVSTMTVRRDLEEMIRQGRAIKTIGGVQRAHAPSYLYETDLHSRLGVQREAKRAIARTALDLVRGRPTLFLDGSTTCLELARLLAAGRKGLTVVTNSVLVCMELGKGGDNTVAGIGGHYDANSLCFVGPQAEDWAKTLFVDMAFVSTKGFIPAKGTFESSLPNFRIKQIIARQCVELVLLVDHSKFGQRALSKVLEPDQIHTVVTDDKVRRADLNTLEKAGCKVHVAGAAAARKASHAA
ncbi:MAG: DeoR family transcriptional regulator [Verrucomicrobia bacterium]|nr:DeoR family transcriptional regulator [Verrucomicrobiota bacterium]